MDSYYQLYDNTNNCDNVVIIMTYDNHTRSDDVIK